MLKTFDELRHAIQGQIHIAVNPVVAALGLVGINHQWLVEGRQSHRMSVHCKAMRTVPFGL
ncbi:hypothetical protein LUX29_18215 [Aureimonas altamirensis]|uniref:hypothetical protein n=1 Tax=Aureimonas altamirensis TaxID=370622 RepID=UPI001E648245|nr:hypothetical protein [Aureimonas altamirensis]UHD44939.1 hypothetical protein LUX29_18215 [Aureimonas altamirensis]